MDAQMGNYVRGKFNEIIIVGSASYITFVLFGLNYAPLLALIVGLSVLIPYVGAAVVTLPIAFCCLFPMGLITRFCLVTGCLWCYPVSGWQCSSADSFFRGR